MTEFQNKNDYTVHYYFNHPEKMQNLNKIQLEPFTLKYVHNVKVAHLWVVSKYGSFKNAIVYARRTNRELDKYNFDKDILPYPFPK